MNKKVLPLAAAVLLAMGGCGGGGGGGSSSSSSSGGTTNSDGEVLSSLVSGIEIPSEISAVPADTSGASSKTVRKVNSFSSAVRALAATTTSGLLATSDYVTAKPSVYVEERSLEQFSVIETVFKALAQTHYADDANVNAGPYKAMISWEEEQGGKDVKTLQTWTVESRMIVMTLPSDVTGNTTGDVNKLYAWIPEVDRETGSERLIKAEFLIYTAPTRADDDSLLDYGEWDMNVLMDADPSSVDTVTGTPDNFFAASARIGTDGSSILSVHENHTEMSDFDGPGPNSAVALQGETKGILFRSGTTGYGVVSYPDWSSCWNFDFSTETSPCAGGTIPVNNAKYSYNANYLGVQEVNDGVDATPVYKDRNLDGAIRVVHRYGLFYADADATAGIAEGDSVHKHVNFGFPVTFTNTASGDGTTTFNDFAYYGAWQGRHQLWGPGNFPSGTTFSRQDVRPGDPVETYTLKEFNGTVTKRSLVTANLSDIQDIPVETWLNDHSDLFYQSSGASGAGWYGCEGDFNWGDSMCYTKGSDMSNPANQIPFTLFTDFASLKVGTNDRKNVNIGYCDMGGCYQYMYLDSDPSITGFTYAGAGFYEATWGDTGRMEPTVPAALLTPSDGMQIWIDMGGSVYVAYTGEFSGPTTTTGWVQKTLESFDESTWTPTFTSGADTAFTPDRGMEYYMNAKGQNYVVTRTDADTTAGFQTGDYSVKLELQTAANPVNTNLSATILPTGASYLASPWDTTHSLKLTLVADPADTNYLLLKVVSDDSGSNNAGDVYTEGTWGLVAYNSSDQPLAADGTALVVDEWGWIDPSQNSGKQPVQFNYEYASSGNSWGKQQFLVYASNAPSGKSVGDYVILSDPITLNNVTLYDNLGADSGDVVSLQFDGWMHGLPDMYRELEKNGWTIDPSFGAKIRRLLAGQLVTDGTKNYFVKPMETSLFLGIVTAFPASPGQPDISLADGVDLTSVPSYTHHEMGGTPTTDADGNPIQVKYSEGKAL